MPECEPGQHSEVQPRNAEYEDTFLAEVESAADRRFGIPGAGYAGRVKARLAIGAERYGDSDFRGKDVIRELLEETPDVAAYALLEAQKQLARDEEESAAFHLFEAAVHAAAADWHARQARVSE